MTGKKIDLPEILRLAENGDNIEAMNLVDLALTMQQGVAARTKELDLAICPMELWQEQYNALPSCKHVQGPAYYTQMVNKYVSAYAGCLNVLWEKSTEVHK